MNVLNRDPVLHSTVLSGGRNAIIHDDQGNPNWMVCIPYYELDWLGVDLGFGAHPAFYSHGDLKKEIWIGQFQSNEIDGVPVSVPGLSQSSYSLEEAREACRNKGPGWHLMTNDEWSAITLWCLWRGFQPTGNTNRGQSHESPFEIGLKQSANDADTLSGSGPLTWRHDGTVYGISDMVGNSKELLDGIKTVDGEFFLAMGWWQPESDWVNTGIKVVDNGEGKPALSVGTEPPISIEAGFMHMLRMDSYLNTPIDMQKRMRQALVDPFFALSGQAKGWVKSKSTGTAYCFRGGDSYSEDKAGLAAATFSTNPTGAIRVAYVA